MIILDPEKTNGPSKDIFISTLTHTQVSATTQLNVIYVVWRLLVKILTIVNRHFIALVLEKLPPRVHYRLYMQKPEDEE